MAQGSRRKPLLQIGAPNFRLRDSIAFSNIRTNLLNKSHKIIRPVKERIQIIYIDFGIFMN